MTNPLPAIPGITCDFPRPDGFSRPDWALINSWIDDQGGGDAGAVLFAAIEAAWTDDLAASISAEYNSYIADNVILVSPQFERDAIATLAFCERVHAWLESVLGPMHPEVSGHHVIVLFDDPDEYWEYCSWFHPEGEFGASAGMTIRMGSVHIAVAPSHDGASEQIIIAHEMLHSFVTDRTLPQWLEEGLAQRCERHFFPAWFPDPDKEDFVRIGNAFDAPNLQRFWTGEAFGMPRDDEEQKAAYSLALILANVILHDFANPRAFFESATWDDAGESAAREHLGRSLSDLAANILGPGDWAPRPEDWPAWNDQDSAED